jgi:hypothetical protein
MKLSLDKARKRKIEVEVDVPLETLAILEKMAKEKNLSCEVFAADIVHRFVQGRLVEKESR